MYPQKSWTGWFLLDGRRALYLVFAWVLCVVLHNATYGLLRATTNFKGDEPFFFLLAVVVIPLYALFAGIYTLAQKFARPGERPRSS